MAESSKSGGDNSPPSVVMRDEPLEGDAEEIDPNYPNTIEGKIEDISVGMAELEKDPDLTAECRGLHSMIHKVLRELEAELLHCYEKHEDLKDENARLIEESQSAGNSIRQKLHDAKAKAVATDQENQFLKALNGALKGRNVTLKAQNASLAQEVEDMKSRGVARQSEEAADSPNAEHASPAPEMGETEPQEAFHQPAEEAGSAKAQARRGRDAERALRDREARQLKSYREVYRSKVVTDALRSDKPRKSVRFADEVDTAGEASAPTSKGEEAAPPLSEE